MRSQVQVLAGPPAIPAGQSAVGSELGAFTGCLGRAGAAPPSPPARPSALPGHPPAAASTTTTHRGRPPSRGRQPHGTRGNLALRPAPVPSRSRGDRPLRTPAASACPQTPRLMGTRRTRPDGRGGHQTAGRWTGGQQTAGRWTGGQQMAGPPDPRRRTQVTGHWTGRTAKPQTTDRTGGHRMLDADRRPTPLMASWHCRPRRRCLPAGRSAGRRVWASNKPGQLSSKDLACVLRCRLVWDDQVAVLPDGRVAGSWAATGNLWPPAGDFMAATGKLLVAAVSGGSGSEQPI